VLLVHAAGTLLSVAAVVSSTFCFFESGCCAITAA